MPPIDEFANQLLEEAKRFFEKAEKSGDAEAEAAHLHASLMLSFCALEAYVNAISEEFSRRSDLSVHELGLLLEQDVKLDDGAFQLLPSLKITRLEDRIDFIYRRFAGNPVDRSPTSWHGRLIAATKQRNQLTHAKDVPSIGVSDVKRAIEAIVETLDALFRGIYKTPFPPANRGVRSKMTF
jgi:HEPN domain-containing protein